jgi:cellobiose-specific phosphotransferase system component IIC
MGQYVMTWRRDGVTGGLLALSVFLVWSSVALGQVQTGADVVPFSWFGLTGILALFAAGVNWGASKAAISKVEKELEMLRDIAHNVVPRHEIDARLARMETKIDTLLVTHTHPTKR